jgi:predicted  nucleic acid-binding Zn-ribbon protein
MDVTDADEISTTKAAKISTVETKISEIEVEISEIKVKKSEIEVKMSEIEVKMSAIETIRKERGLTEQQQSELDRLGTSLLSKESILAALIGTLAALINDKVELRKRIPGRFNVTY